MQSTAFPPKPQRHDRFEEFKNIQIFQLSLLQAARKLDMDTTKACLADKNWQLVKKDQAFQIELLDAVLTWQAEISQKITNRRRAILEVLSPKLVIRIEESTSNLSSNPIDRLLAVGKLRRLRPSLTIACSTANHRALEQLIEENNCAFNDSFGLSLLETLLFTATNWRSENQNKCIKLLYQNGAASMVNNHAEESAPSTMEKLREMAEKNPEKFKGVLNLLISLNTISTGTLPITETGSFDQIDLTSNPERSSVTQRYESTGQLLEKSYALSN